MTKKKTKVKNYQNFEVIEIDREKVKNAPYNPRTISTEARKHLRDNIKRVGLLVPIVWNKTTGNVVSGHQRIKALDDLNKDKDYKVKVAMVELDEKTEAEQNMFMNNLDAQGTFDFEKLDELLSKPFETMDGEQVVLDLNNIAFKETDVYNFLGHKPFELRSHLLVDITEKLKKNREILDKMKKNIQKRDERIESYCVIVFRTYEDRQRFAHFFEGKDTRYVNGESVMKKLSEGNGSNE